MVNREILLDNNREMDMMYGWPVLSMFDREVQKVLRTPLSDQRNVMSFSTYASADQMGTRLFPSSSSYRTLNTLDALAALPDEMEAEATDLPSQEVQILDPQKPQQLERMITLPDSDPAGILPVADVVMKGHVVSLAAIALSYFRARCVFRQLNCVGSYFA